jgi:energy-coupling factor transporter ATP-binding protein EcfA2
MNDELQQALKNFSEEQFVEAVTEKFYGMSDLARKIYIALKAGKNIILWGKGGFGKTSLMKEIATILSLDISVVVGYEDMDVESLLGIPDMKKLIEESEYEIAFEKTKFNKKALMVLEEFLDVNPKTAIALKDIITEKGFRQGSVFVPSNSLAYIICSNKSPEDVSIDYSTSAFYQERFPIRLEVKWNNYDYFAYVGLIQKVVSKDGYEEHKEAYDVLAELCSATTNSRQTVSPRLVIDAIDILKTNNFDVFALDVLEGLDTSTISSVMAHCKQRNETTRITALSHNLHDLINSMLSEHTEQDISRNISKLNYIKKRLQSLEIVHEENIEIASKLLDSCERTQIALWKTFDKVSKTAKETIDKIFNDHA